MHHVIRQTAKKIFKAGYFHSITVTKDSIFYKDVNNVHYFFDWLHGKPFGYFRAGYITQWQELAPTFESEYNSYGIVDRAKFSPLIEQTASNPDYILRASLSIINHY